jgi:hypothetical protein
MFLDRIRQRTQEWFDDAKKKWNSLMQEAIYTDRNFENFFGNPHILRSNIAKDNKARTVVDEELLECERRIYEVTNWKPLWDQYRGYYERTPEQAQELLRVLRKEKDSLRLNLVSRNKWREKCHAKLRSLRRPKKARWSILES